MPNNSFLYHGSPYLLDVITPHISGIDDEPLVYATNDYKFALMYAGRNTDDLEINQAYYNGVYMLTEILPCMFKDILKRKGYVYTVLADSFMPINDNEFVSHEAVKPVKTIEIPNVLKALKDEGTVLYRFPNLPPFIKSRTEYAEERCRRFDVDYREWKNKYVEQYKLWRSLKNDKR